VVSKTRVYEVRLAAGRARVSRARTNESLPGVICFFSVHACQRVRFVPNCRMRQARRSTAGRTSPRVGSITPSDNNLIPAQRLQKNVTSARAAIRRIVFNFSMLIFHVRPNRIEEFTLRAETIDILLLCERIDNTAG
jgi:hypothetical protein